MNASQKFRMLLITIFGTFLLAMTALLTGCSAPPSEALPAVTTEAGWHCGTP